MESFPYVHIHPLDPNGKLTGKCCVCEKTDSGERCYVCEKCNFFFCYKCKKHTEKEELMKLHQHPMEPKKRNFWLCDICRSTTYTTGVSMCCQLCGFDVCVKCFWGLTPAPEQQKIY